MKRVFLNAAVLAGFAAAPFAVMAQNYSDYNQDVSVEALGSAQNYDVGAQSSSGIFGPGLWSGTSSAVAKSVIGRAPIKSRSAATRDLVEQALLTGGSPPAGAQDDPDYMTARLGLLVKMGRGSDVEQILGRQPQQAGTQAGQQLKADKALLAGQVDEACLIADNVSEGRTEPYWAKLRAFCHVTREEIPAAELTADLLRRSGHEDKLFFDSLRRATGMTVPGTIDTGDDALLLAMAKFSGVETLPSAADADDSLSALIKAAPELSAEDLAKRLSRLTVTTNIGDDELSGGYFDTETAIAQDTPASWGRLYGVVISGTDAQVQAKAAGELLRRADANNVLPAFASLLSDPLSRIPAYLKTSGHIPTFAKLAVIEGDLSTLRALYDALPENDPFKIRLALASDALGNGFMMGTLGQDMTANLSASGETKRRAVRDAFIAVNLGAQLSDESALALDGFSETLTGRAASPSQLLALKAAAARGARAETALRAAGILGNDGPSTLRADTLGAVLAALQAVNLQPLAGRLAAEDFLAL